MDGFHIESFEEWLKKRGEILIHMTILIQLPKISSTTDQQTNLIFLNKQASYDDYKTSNNGVYRPFFKTNKKMVVNSSYDGYGMKTALSDNIKDVISYEYAREIELLQKKKHESLMSLKS